MSNKQIFVDRVSATPNRRKIKIISQTADEIIADIEMADNPTESGTAINAEMLNNIQDIAYEALNQVTQKQGTIVQENGAYVNTFYADKKLDINQGLLNTNRIMITDENGKITPSNSLRIGNCQIYGETDNNGQNAVVIEYLDSGNKIYLNPSLFYQINQNILNNTNEINETIESFENLKNSKGYKTLLWSGSIGTNGYTFSIDASLAEYDVVLCCGSAWTNTSFTFLVGTTKLQPAYSGNYTSATINSGVTGCSVKGTSFFASVKIDNVNNTITYNNGYDNTGASNNAYLQRIYGIKFGGQNED